MSAPVLYNATYQPEIIIVPDDTENVCCDGGQGALGHPVVYYAFDGRRKVECGYCDRIFMKQAEVA